MRILFCTNSLGAVGGIERVTIVKANALAELEGNEVGICFTDRGTYPQMTMYPLSPRVHVYDLETPYWNFVSIAKLAIGFLPMMLRTRKAICRLVSDFKPDVVITTGSYEKYALATISDKILSRLAGHKCIKIREYHFNSGYRRFLRAGRLGTLATRIVESFENHILSRSFDKSFLLTQQDFVENLHENPRFDVMPNPSTFSENEGLEELCRNKIVLSAGRLTYQKNYEALVEIWSMIAKSFPDWKLRIVGSGNKRSTLVELADSLGVGNSVEFPGFSSDVEREMKEASIFALTSRFEGYVLVLPEAKACGLPIVSFDTPYSPSEIVRDGIDGFIVPCGDKARFAEALVKLMSDEELRRRMGERGLEDLARFDVKEICRRWMEKYRGLLDRKK